MAQFRRRQLLACAASVLMLPVVRAQETAHVRRLGVLTSGSATDPLRQRDMAALRQSLTDLGWKVGRTLQIEYRYGDGDSSRMPKLAKEIIGLRPDVIFGGGTLAVAALRQQTLSIPIVFVQVSDPVAQGFVTNLARPNGNLTGFAIFEFSIAGKWLQLVRELAPKASRVAVLFEPAVSSWISYVRALEGAAPQLGFQLLPASAENPAELESRWGEFAKSQIGGLIVLPGPLTLARRSRIVALAAQHRIPTIYPYNIFTAEGGLVSYGIDTTEEYRHAASYIDRILRGAKPVDLPVQQPTKFELIVNLKTAKALGVKISPSILQRADKVIE